MVDRDKVMEEAERYAGIIAKNGPLAVAAIKKAVLTISGLTVEEGLVKEQEIATPVFATKDAREGPRAFKEKRKPKYISE